MRHGRLLIVMFAMAISGCGCSPDGPSPSNVRPDRADIPWIGDGRPLVDLSHAELIQNLGHGDQSRQREAELALLEKGDAVIPELIGALDDKNGHVRAGAIRTLGLFGPAAQAALPKLHEIVGDEGEWEAVRDAAEFNIPVIDGSEES
jgi:HEAT repeat protein